jgi:hypothetical protein
LISGTVLAISSRLRGVRVSNPVPAIEIHPLPLLRALSSDRGEVHLELRAWRAPDLQETAASASRTPTGPVIKDHSTELRPESIQALPIPLPERACA